MALLTHLFGALWRQNRACRKLPTVFPEFVGAPQAVEELYYEMMDGFLRWRTKLAEHEPAAVPSLSGDEPLALDDNVSVTLRYEPPSFEPFALARPRPVGGARWEPLRKDGLDPATAAILSRQLTEMAVYLLVWGEAGNVRFMPEVGPIVSVGLDSTKT